jgi:hypothetical protein
MRCSGCDVHRQPGLAGPGRPGQREKADILAQQGLDGLRKIFLSPDELRGLRRQIVW